MVRAILCASAAAVALSSGALAQTWNLNPTYGSVNLRTGFLPDPYVTNVQAGGDRNARNLPGNCRGYVANAPDFNLNYQAGSTLPLIIGAESSSDTTLVVNQPNGSWICDDDGGPGLNPRMTISNPQSGLYNIWVGTYSSTAGFPQAQLYISELTSVTGPNSGGMTSPPTSPPPPTASGPNISLPATYGNVTLRSGFLPDPHRTNLQSGGPINANVLSRPGQYCNGYIARAPDVELRWTAGSLPLIIGAVSDRDTTLVINGPDGTWHCNDDGGPGLNPRLRFQPSQSGVYDIYVGSYGSTNNYAAQLLISELDSQVPGDGPVTSPPVSPPVSPPTGGGRPDYTLPASYGNVTLRTGFMPDPHVTNLQSGGPISASSAISGATGACRGYIAQAPDVELRYTGGSSLPLIISVDSSADTTLVVNTPDGRWHCNDDGGQGLNPSMRFDSPQSGTYDIWVGTYGSASLRPAQLHISELYSQ